MFCISNGIFISSKYSFKHANLLLILDCNELTNGDLQQIDFASLVDLRLIKQGNLDSSKAAVNKEITSVNQTAESSMPIHNNGDANNAKQGLTIVSIHTRNSVSGSWLSFNGQFYDWSSGNGKVSAWDEISEALSAKKAELSQNDGWNQEESSGRRSWSHRGLRGSALGPVMALLRAQNEL